MAKGRFDKKVGFNVVLTDPVGCSFDEKTDGGEESCICHVLIEGKVGETRMNLIKKMESRINSQQRMLGHGNWGKQFYDAIFNVEGDEEEEEEDEGEDNGKDGPGAMDFLMHFVAMPWKLLFAFVPPVEY